MTRWIRVVAVGAAVALSLPLGGSARAQSTVSGPSVTLNRYEASPGEDLILNIAGFQASAVTISVCGNEARLGSEDCDMRASLARETPDGSRTTDFTVTAPPAPCPCIVRVSSQDNLEIAVAPIVIVGHPVGEVVDAQQAAPALAVSIVANAASVSLSEQLRASLGGAKTYDLRIRVTNTATFEVPDVAVAATFTRTRLGDIRSIDIPNPGALAAGSTWEETVQVTVPALTFGDVEWRSTVSGQGPSVSSTATTSSQPILLYLLGLVLAVDLLILLWRLIARARRRRVIDDWEPQLNSLLDDPAPATGPLRVNDSTLADSSDQRNDRIGVA